MGLFSFSRKNKQEPAAGDSGFYSRPDDEAAPARSRARRKDTESNDAADPVLPEKKRARRRLVGAIALVLAAVIGLPMIFDSEPKPVADDITIQIPSKDKPAAKGNDNGQAASSSPSMVAASDSLDAKEEMASASNHAAGMTTVAAAGAVAATAVAIKNKESSSQSDTSKTNSASKPAGKAQSTDDNADKKPAQQSKPKPESREVADKPGSSKASADKKQGKFVLQVAALMTQEKISELQRKLKKAGFKPLTQKVATESGISTRIRVGPYATKEEADKARAKLIKMGLNGTPVSH